MIISLGFQSGSDRLVMGGETEVGKFSDLGSSRSSDIVPRENSSEAMDRGGSGGETVTSVLTVYSCHNIIVTRLIRILKR